MKPQVVLAIGAHPDDIDFGAGGTMAAFAAQGAAVHYLQLTDGCCGSADPNADCAEIALKREQEQLRACEILGGTSVEFLPYRDGRLINNRALQTDIVRTIRKLKPDTVIGWDPTMVYSVAMGFVNHPDHRAAGQATLDAVYPMARDILALPEVAAEGLQPHKVKTLLLMNFNEQNYYVDTTEYHAIKLRAVRAHTSQLDDPDGMCDMFTEHAKRTGKDTGHAFAEGFMRITIAS